MSLVSVELEPRKAPTAEEIISAFDFTREKYGQFEPRVFKGNTRPAGGEGTRCGCAIAALYVQSGCPIGDSDSGPIVAEWARAVYGDKVFRGIISGFDGGEYTESADRYAYDEARKVHDKFFDDVTNNGCISGMRSVLKEEYKAR